jgi:hypothetical protein
VPEAEVRRSPGEGAGTDRGAGSGHLVRAEGVQLGEGLEECVARVDVDVDGRAHGGQHLEGENKK